MSYTPEGAETGTSTGGEGQVYEQVDGGEGGVAVSDPTYLTTHPAAYSSLDMSKSWEMAKPDTHLYDQVDKGKKGKMATHPHTPETTTAVDHFYAIILLEDNRERIEVTHIQRLT